MLIEGDRVALIAIADGRLQRRGIYSTTLIVPSLRKKNTFKAAEEIHMTVHADAAGSFDAALKAIFVNGFGELAAAAPPYWRCYAAGYFAQDVTDAEAETTLNACLRGESVETEPSRNS